MKKAFIRASFEKAGSNQKPIATDHGPGTSGHAHPYEHRARDVAQA